MGVTVTVSLQGRLCYSLLCGEEDKPVTEDMYFNIFPPEDLLLNLYQDGRTLESYLEEFVEVCYRVSWSDTAPPPPDGVRNVVLLATSILSQRSDTSQCLHDPPVSEPR